ncbi:MAG TPA: hypothetical protein VHC42_01690 [Rhizomicrobium sp.]|nr:hypothetical protein [Rhizomicrobium sp.]
MAEHQFGLDLDHRAGEAGAGRDRTLRRFKSLALEGVTIANPAVEIVVDLGKAKVPDPSFAPQIGSRLPETEHRPGFGDMVLGMDILRRLHIYIAYGERKLYVTPAGPPGESAPPAPSGAH